MFVMNKIQPNYHQGVAYIQLAQLPPDQAGRFNAWLPSKSKFTMLLEDIELQECVGYHEYERWFDHINFESEFHYNFL